MAIVRQSIEDWQVEITEWSNQQFPHRTMFGTLSKLVLEEIPEFQRAPHDPLEYADLLILLLDLASQQGIDVGAALREKMEINRSRSWVLNEDGMYKHVKEDNGQ